MALQERVEVLGRHGHRVRSSTRARATRPPDAFGTFPCPSFWRGPQTSRTRNGRWGSRGQGRGAARRHRAVLAARGRHPDGAEVQEHALGALLGWSDAAVQKQSKAAGGEAAIRRRCRPPMLPPAPEPGGRSCWRSRGRWPRSCWTCAMGRLEQVPRGRRARVDTGTARAPACAASGAWLCASWRRCGAKQPRSKWRPPAAPFCARLATN